MAPRTGSGPDSRFEDLAQYLCLVACRLALDYDPERVRPGYSFSSYLHDVLQRRCVDWHRQRAEGYTDRRYRPEACPLCDAAQRLRRSR